MLRFGVRARDCLIAFLLLLVAFPIRAETAAAPDVPSFSRVIVIVSENRGFDEVIGNAKMPRFNAWAEEYTLLGQYYAVTHPSLPNHIAMIGGDFFGIQTNCTDCLVRARSLPDLLEEAGRAWKAYQEGLPDVRRGFRDETPYSHYSLLKTIAAAWGLPALRHAADPAVNLIALPFQTAVARTPD